MYVVNFLDNRNVLLTQLRQIVPTEGEDLTIKGRKAKVTTVTNSEENHVQVQVVLEAVNKKQLAVDNSKKKKR